MVSRIRAINERDIWCTARALIEEHCERAGIHLAQRADALLAEGELECHRAWKWVLAAIDAIQRPAPREGENVI
jgi:hypothetical protein